MDMKNFWQSKTIWANVLAILAAVAASQGIDVTPEVQGQVVAAGMGVMNIILRSVTTTGVSIR
jgi:hypothetical protein